MPLVDYSVFIYFLVFILGLCLGSFINSWVWRTWENCRIISGRSMCVHCHRQLRWFENIPLFSFVGLRGKCLSCKKAIPWHYPAVEFITAALLTLVFWYHVNYLPFVFTHFLRDIFFVSFLIVIFIFDGLYKVILPQVVAAGALVGLAANIFDLHYSPMSMLWGIVFAVGLFGGQFVISKGRWIGGGDIYLGAMMGIWLGWPNIVVAIFLAYILGAIVAIGLIIFKKKSWQTEIPFGTFLAVGTFFALYHGAQVIKWYWGLLR